MALFNFLITILFAGFSGWHWYRLKTRYAKNLQLLTEMEKTHGDQLPWIKMENHFAQLEQLKRDLAQEKAKAE